MQPEEHSFKVGRVLWPLSGIGLILSLAWCLAPFYFCYYIYFFRSRWLRTKDQLYVTRARIVSEKSEVLDRAFEKMFEDQAEFDRKLEQAGQKYVDRVV